MKKSIIFLTFSLAVLTSFGQASVTSAYNANKGGDYAKAAEYIEQAVVNEKAAAKEKTWRYRGTIYLNISQSEELKAGYPEALQIAYDSFIKAMELDSKGSYERDNKIALGNVQTVAMNNGIELFNGEDYTNAAKHFELSKLVSEYFEVVDSMAIYNTALCFEKANDHEAAIAKYRECAALEYRVPSVYLFIANLQKQNDDKEGAMATYKEGRAKHPNSQALIIEELNMYLNDKKFEEAVTNLELAIQGDPENEILHFSLGTVHDNLGQQELAAVAYQKAIDLKDDYTDAHYNLGAMYFNQAVEMVNDANAIPPNQIKKYNAAMEEANKVFNVGLPSLERAHKLDPSNKETMTSLRDIYTRLEMDDKSAEMKEKLEK
jgi:tetratricopeptide (TPR) repeat protein